MTARLARAVCGLVTAGCLGLAGPSLAGPAPDPGVAPPSPSSTPARPDAALARLRATHPALTTTRRPGSPVPSVISGLSVPTAGPTPEARVEGFLAAHRDLFGGAELTVERAAPRPGRTLVHLRQRHGALPVLDRGAVVVLDDAGRVVRISGDVRPLTRLDRATIDEADARALALRHLGLDAAAPATLERRGVVAVGGHGIEVIEVELSRQPLAEHLVVRIDAHAGRVIGVRNRMVH